MTSFRVKWLARAAAGVVAVALVYSGMVTPSHPAAAGPVSAQAVAVTVSQSSGLTDPQTISVSGTGWPNNATIFIGECKGAPSLTSATCNSNEDSANSATTNGSGAFGPVSITVYANFNATELQTGNKSAQHCMTGSACTVAATYVNQAQLFLSKISSIPISFTAEDPTTTLATIPPPTTTTTVPPTTTTTVPPTTTTVPPTTTTVPPTTTTVPPTTTTVPPTTTTVPPTTTTTLNRFQQLKCNALMASRSATISRYQSAYSRATTDLQRQAIVNSYAKAIAANDKALATNKCPAAPAPPVLGSTSVQSQATESTYTVQPGDNLSSISLRLLGNANSYGRLFAANSAQIANPSLIHPGQILVIPTT